MPNYKTGSDPMRPQSIDVYTDYKKDMVNHPTHYADGSIECIDAMIAAKGIEKVKAFCECNAFKYLWRLGKKDNPKQEIGKIEWYLNKLKELNEK